jgi:hypothetical protein
MDRMSVRKCTFYLRAYPTIKDTPLHQEKNDFGGNGIVVIINDNGLQKL